MLRSILFAIALSFVLAGTLPTFAAQSCQEWCMQNRCAHGALNQPLCMSRCVPACQEKRGKKG